MEYVGRLISLIVAFMQHEFTVLGFTMSWWSIMLSVAIMTFILYVVFGIMEG